MRHLPPYFYGEMLEEKYLQVISTGQSKSSLECQYILLENRLILELLKLLVSIIIFWDATELEMQHMKPGFSNIGPKWHLLWSKFG